MTILPADEVMLTPSQRSMLIASLREPVDPPYLLQLILPLAPEVTESAWLAAWKRVVDAHSILRMGYAGGNPWIASPALQPEWASEDLCHLTADAYHEETRRLFTRERKAGFDLSATSTRTLCRCLWVHPPAAEAPIWCLTIHHALVDGNSLAPLVGQIIQALENHNSIPSESHFQARARLVQNADWGDAREFFRKSRGSQVPVGDPGERLPRSGNRVSGSGEMHRVPLVIDAELQRQIDARHDFRPDTLVHAAWSLMLSRITDSNSIVFGVTRHCRGRRSEGLHDALGPFSNVLPLCIGVPEDTPAASWLVDVRDAWLALEPFECCPLREIRLASLDEYREGRGFETLVNVVREAPVTEVERVLGRLAAYRPVFHQKTDLPLSLVVYTQPALAGLLVARNDAFSRQQAEMFACLFVQALRQIVSRCSDPVSELSLGSPSDLELGRGCDVERSVTNVLALLRDTVSRHGDAVALSTPTRSLDFDELWQRAGAFAAEIDSRGVQHEDVVAILSGRSVDTVIAMIGTLRAGAAFFVVNEDLPLDRQVENIRAAGSRFLVSPREPGDALDDQFTGVQRVFPSHDTREVACTDRLPKVHDLAYLVATSGTTGSPNIVMIEHGSLVNMLQGYADVLRPAPGDVRYQSVSASSDTFVLEVMLYLCFGASLHIDPSLLESGLARFDLALRRRGITIIGLPSSLWREWAEQQLSDRTADRSGDGSLRAVVCSMERTDPEALRLWREQKGRDLLWINAYGPSETACVACLFPLQPGEAPPEEEVPIGRPLPNVQVYVVDSKRRHLPAGVIGEIAIGGSGVGRGYANNPEQTAAKFVADPFAADAQARLYLTGDQGYFREDGNLVFVGRSDNQVKIRGHRIELEEVELALVRYPQVRDAAAVTVPHGRSMQLITFYTADKSLGAHELRAHLLTLLSPAAIPHRFVKRDVIPRDPLGKVSRRLLTEEGAKLVASDAPVADASLAWNARASLETRLCHLFGRVLDIRAFDAQDDFFLLGGDSLHAFVLLSEIEQHGGHAPSITDLFLHPSPARLAAHLEGRTQQSSTNCLVPLSPGGESAPLLFFHGYKGDLFQYLPLAKALGADRPVWGLQAIELADEARDPSVEAMGARYAAEILNACENIPSYLCGYSAGGLIAFETARHLLEQGFPIKRLLIIDTLPFNLPMTTHLKMHAAHLRQRFVFHLETLLRERHDVVGYTRDRFRALRKLISKGGRPDQAQRRKLGIPPASDYYGALILMYQPQPLPLEVTLFQSTAGMRDPSAGWRYLATRGLRVVPVPWQHLAIMQEVALNDLAALFRLELER